MDAEPLNFEEKLRQRKQAARESLHEMSEKELLDLVAKLFPDGMHPWVEGFTEFIQQHRSEVALGGDTPEGLSFVYFPVSKKGIWYQTGPGGLEGVGLLGKGGLEALAEITGT